MCEREAPHTHTDPRAMRGRGGEEGEMAAVPPGAAEQSRAVPLAHNRYPHSPGGHCPCTNGGLAK